MYKLEDLNNDKIVFELHRKLWNVIYNIYVADDVDEENKFLNHAKNNALDSLYLNKIIDEELYHYILCNGSCLFCSASACSDFDVWSDACSFCLKYRFIENRKEDCLGGLYYKATISCMDYCKSKNKKYKQELLGYIKEIKLLGTEN